MKIIIKRTILIIWMVVIFLLSNENASFSQKRSDIISDTIVKVLEVFNDKEYSSGDIVVNNISHIVRKSAHFFLYFILAIIISWNLNINLQKEMVLLTILLCSFYASTDELHQVFVEGRSGEITDVIWDTFASTIGCLLYYKYKKVD